MLQRKNCLRTPVSVVAALLVATSVAFPQTPGFLKLTVVEGEGAFNDMKRKIGHPPSVRVVDEGNQIVVGAEITCTLPLVGPGGLMVEGGGRIGTALTDDKGTARCPAYRPNGEEGRFNVKVVASFQSKTGQVMISQSNTLAGGSGVSEQKKSNKALWILALVAGGAAVGGVVAVTHGGSSSTQSPPTPTTLSAGGITVGAPR